MKKLIIALSLLFIPFLVSASIDTNLYYGLHNNAEVKELQEFLIDKGLLIGPATGNFYTLTLKAVKNYQTSVSLPKSGYVGTLTRNSINQELGVNLFDSNQEATIETGTTPPMIKSQKTSNNDVVSGIQSQIALLQQQLDTLNNQNQATPQVQQNTQQIVQSQPINSAQTTMVEDKIYDHLTYTINPNPAPFDGTTQANIVVNLINKSGLPLSGKEVVVGLAKGYKNLPSDTLNLISDANGQVAFNGIMSSKMNNFLLITIVGEPSKWITIPTSFEGKIWNFTEADGGSFTPQ